MLPVTTSDPILVLLGGFEPAVSRVKAGLPDHWQTGALFSRTRGGESNSHRDRGDGSLDSK